MWKITIFVLFTAVALVETALVGVGFAQFATPTLTVYDVVAPYCYDATGTVPTYCVNGLAGGYCAVSKLKAPIDMELKTATVKGFKESAKTGSAA